MPIYRMSYFEIPISLCRAFWRLIADSCGDEGFKVGKFISLVRISVVGYGTVGQMGFGICTFLI
jgi:hypothetical protein